MQERMTENKITGWELFTTELFIEYLQFICNDFVENIKLSRIVNIIIILINNVFGHTVNPNPNNELVWVGKT